MVRYNVEYKGKWAMFSSVVDAFVTTFLEKEEHEKWIKKEYKNEGIVELEKSNIKKMEEAVFLISLNRERKEIKKCLMQVGIEEDESEVLLKNMEEKYYKPQKNENGIYQCPNCKSEVKEKDKECKQKLCEIRLIW